MTRAEHPAGRARHERPAIVIINTRSRKARRSFDAALALLARQGITVLAAHDVTDPGELAGILGRELDAHDCPLVIIGGGDGTISEVVDLLAGTDRVLGLLPLGTSNNFARTLGIPLDLRAAVEVIANGKLADVDLGLVAPAGGGADELGDYFANVASIGVSARIATSVPGWSKRFFGRLAYVITAVKVIASQPSFDVTLTIDGVSDHLRAQQVVIANGRFHAGRPIAESASADDRRLTVQTITAPRRTHLAIVLLSYLAGRGDRSPHTLLTTASHATIDCAPAQAIEIDGELKATTPVRISVAAEALNVLVPHSFADR